MNGILFDRSLGWVLPKHFQACTFLEVYTRKDIIGKPHRQNPEWSVSDLKFIRYAFEHDLILVTSDKMQHRIAKKMNVQSIFMYGDDPLWLKIERVLQKLNHPFFKLFEIKVLDMRDLWHDASTWANPSSCNTLRRKRIHETDPSFTFQ